MRTLMAVLILFGSALAVYGQSPSPSPADKQKKLEATKLENCPRLKDYFSKRANLCPKAAAKAAKIECKTTEDHDALNDLMRPCSREVDASGVLEAEAAPPAPEVEALCKGMDPADGAVIAASDDESAAKCKKAVKEQIIAKKCDGKIKKFVARYQRKKTAAVALTVKCPKVKTAKK